MNLKTTFLLIVLAGAGVGAWYWADTRKVEVPASTTFEFLKDSLTPARINRIEASRGKEKLFTLEKVGNDWVLPGKWPCRQQEADQVVNLLSALRSRYVPIAITDKTDLKPYGLADDPLVIKITTGDESHTLRFGEEPGDTNRFTRPTFLRVDDKPELVRLGPGVTASLDRKLDYFQQRRLFPVERVAKDDDGKDKVEQLDAAEVQVESGNSRFTLVKKDKDWVLKNWQKKKDKEWENAGSNDRVNPDRLNSLLRSFPDLWAEKFVEKKDRSLEDFGLKEPEYTLYVAKAGGSKRKLLVGKVSDTKTTTEKTPPPNPFGQPPMPPRQITEEYRFARLDGNDQIFEIKADKLNDIAVPLDALRDANLARFKADDVKRVEFRHGDKDLVLVKVTEKDNDVEKHKWRLEKPTREEADTRQVEEMLQKLANLEARDKDVLDNVDAKTVGLDKPAARIKITVEEGKKDKDKKDDAEAKDKVKTRDIVLTLGVKDKEKDKVYVRVDAWPRVNQVGSEVLKLAERSELAYRPRELWKLDRDGITRITIDAQTPYTLERKDKKWKVAPLDTEIAGKEIDDLADDLSHLRAERFEAAHVKDFAQYGLDLPAYKITLVGKDTKPYTLEVGKQTEGGRFARLAGGDAVFVVNDKLLANVRKDPFELLDRNLLSLDALDIQRVRFESASPFTLEEAKKGTWQVTSGTAPPFNVSREQLAVMLTPFAKLRAEKYAAFGGTIDWDRFGLAKPALKIVVTVKDVLGKTKDHVIELGKETGMGGRYARVDNKDSVAVLDDAVAAMLQRKYVDFVDSRVLNFDLEALTRIDRQMKDAPLELSHRGDDWQITKPGIRDADNLTVFDLLKRVANLQARRIAAFPAKDLKEFGLDRPTAVVTLHLEDLGRKHVIKVGNLTKDASHKETDERFAMIDDKSMVIVLSPELSRRLVAPALFYADRNLASFSGADRVELTRGPRKLVFARDDKGWQMTQPAKAGAESAELDDLVRGLQRLRADEIVADKTADLKKFGLDTPAAEWRFKTGDMDRLHLIVGAPENDKPDARRYAKLGDKAGVFLLNVKLTAKATAEYRSRNLWEPFRTKDVEELTVSGPAKPYTLLHKDGKWTVAGMPDVQVREPQLADTLGALAYVRIKSYVADGKADLKAFGLEKPSWKIEVKTAKGKHELLLGTLEPGTKLFYATTPGSGTVFTIDALDSIVLARPLAELIEEKKK